MTNRERLVAALNFKETDRMPFAPLVDGYFLNGAEKQGYGNDYFKVMDYIGCDILKRHCPSLEYKYSDKIKIDNTVVDGVITTEIKTPIGSINEQNYYKDGTQFKVSHFIKTIEDVKVYTYFAQNTFFTPREDLFIEAEKEIGDRGIASADGATSPLLEILQTACGIENTTYFLADEQELMEELFNALHERNIRMYKTLADMEKVPIVFTYEDTSTTIMNKEWLKVYALPTLNTYAEILQKSGKKFITHMCGKLSGFLLELQENRADGYDSLCPPTTGDLNICDARASFPDKILIGGLEPPRLTRLNKSETIAYAKDVIESLKNRRGVILSSGDAVSNNTPMENLVAIANLVKGIK